MPGVFLYPPMCWVSNSSSVRSLNWLTPIVHEAPDLLCCSYFLKFCWNTVNLLSNSALTWYVFPNCSLNLANWTSSWPGAGTGWAGAGAGGLPGAGAGCLAGAGAGCLAAARVTETRAAEMRATFMMLMSVLETQGTETQHHEGRPHLR